MIKYLTNDSFIYLEKELKKIKSYKELKRFYLSFFKKFKKLNLKYKFTTVVDFSYIKKQLKNINFKKKSIFFAIPFGLTSGLANPKVMSKIGFEVFSVKS